MEQQDPDVVEGTDGPTFWREGRVVRVKREGTKRGRKSPALGYIVYLAIVVTIAAVDAVFLRYSPYEIIFLLLFFSFFYFIYLFNYRKDAAMTLELTRDEAVLSYDHDPPEEVARVRFQRGTVVDAVLDEAAKSEKYGPLYGWTFTDGAEVITISAADGWELWDIQALREPVYELVEHHGLERGEALRYYQQGLAGVFPKRRRTL